MSRGGRPQTAPTDQTPTTLPARECVSLAARCRCTAANPTLDDCRAAWLEEHLADLRRRREAASRLRPMADGRRDPLDSGVDGHG